MKRLNLCNLNIDLNGKLCIIDDSGDILKWNKICDLNVSSIKNAKVAMKKHNLKMAWLIDKFQKRLITL